MAHSVLHAARPAFSHLFRTCASATIALAIGALGIDQAATDDATVDALFNWAEYRYPSELGSSSGSLVAGGVAIGFMPKPVFTTATDPTMKNFTCCLKASVSRSRSAPLRPFRAMPKPRHQTRPSLRPICSAACTETGQPSRLLMRPPGRTLAMCVLGSTRFCRPR